MYNANLYLPQEPFEGTFAQLLPLLREHPEYVAYRTGSMKALIRGLDRDGVGGAEGELDAVLRYFFDSEPAGRKALILVGTPGGGRAHRQRFDDLKRIRRSREQALCLEGCPLHDNPLSLLFMVPRVARVRFNGTISAALPEAIAIVSKLKLVPVLNWNNPAVDQIVSAHDVEKSGEGLAKLALASIKDFVSLVVYGLDLPISTRESLQAMPCPRCQALVDGKFVKPIEIADFPVGAWQPALDQGIVETTNSPSAREDSVCAEGLNWR